MRIFNRTVQNACSTAVGHYADSQEASQTLKKKKKKKKPGCFKAPHAHSMVVEGHLL